jgi:tetratricopeptide (TPR) repeat protein
MLILCAVVLIMQTPTELYNQANGLYEQGKFASAAELYETALVSTKHPDLYYNLGNAYFKQGKMGKAILNYRRALFLAPRDQDVNFNLVFARNYRVDKTRVKENPFSIILRRILRMLSMLEAQLTTTLLFIMTMFILAIYIITRSSRYGYICIATLCVTLILGVGWLHWANTLHARNAVVTTPEVSALSGPGSDYKEILVLHDGAEVRIREIRGDYALIQLPGGLGGWAPLSALEQVF